MVKKKDKFEVESAIFLDHIQASGLRRTSQRDLILEIFLSTEEHLTSEDLHGLIHRKDPSVGLTTVYRTLKLLTEAGLPLNDPELGPFPKDVRHIYESGEGVIKYNHLHYVTASSGEIDMLKAIDAMDALMTERIAKRKAKEALERI